MPRDDCTGIGAKAMTALSRAPEAGIGALLEKLIYLNAPAVVKARIPK